MENFRAMGPADHVLDSTAKVILIRAKSGNAVEKRHAKASE